MLSIFIIELIILSIIIFYYKSSNKENSDIRNSSSIRHQRNIFLETER
ncbi:hypothetical protein BACCOP_01883 [Phocaeicola coprocola DSM 17136]|uniref:Uncharacterized protein n=1 Tax=Phocaeicola coprocola DSM 17136 TaxID=470145 RepID=B3JJ21_9BACT|nr:hypothetical protein BACCOP_01883 [Phocaeicola coprocola DSM 17136]